MTSRILASALLKKNYLKTIENLLELLIVSPDKIGTYTIRNGASLS